MGKIVISENVTLDGVVEDPTGEEGSPVGGWFGRIADRAELNQLALDEALDAEALLMGRRTFAFFGARWPARTGPLADRLNTLPKYVVSTTLAEPAWHPSTVVTVGDVAGLRERLAGNILVLGSQRLAHALIEQDLADELRLKIHPVVLGGGARLFGPIGDRRPMRLTGTRALGDGVACLTYARVPA